MSYLLQTWGSSSSEETEAKDVDKKKRDLKISVLVSKQCTRKRTAIFCTFVNINEVIKLRYRPE